MRVACTFRCSAAALKSEGYAELSRGDGLRGEMEDAAVEPGGEVALGLSTTAAPPARHQHDAPPARPGLEAHVEGESPALFSFFLSPRKHSVLGVTGRVLPVRAL